MVTFDSQFSFLSNLICAKTYILHAGGMCLTDNVTCGNPSFESRIACDGQIYAILGRLDSGRDGGETALLFKCWIKTFVKFSPTWTKFRAHFVGQKIKVRRRWICSVAWCRARKLPWSIRSRRVPAVMWKTWNWIIQHQKRQNLIQTSIVNDEFQKK